MTWAIGDIQGCDAGLEALLARVSSVEPDVPIWFVGDLVNRGPASDQVLRRIRALDAQAVAVLGNHDMHLLAVWAGARQMRKKDTLHTVLQAPDAADLIDWLRHRPLLHLGGVANVPDPGADPSSTTYALVHAGLYPDLPIQTLLDWCGEVQDLLHSRQWARRIGWLFGNHPAHPSDIRNGEDRLRFTVNACLRMRYLHADGRLDFETKESLAEAPKGLSPWFERTACESQRPVAVFGHWSTLGLTQTPQAIGLDTGHIWGGPLTAMNLRTREIQQWPEA